ncbi:MAG: hypothetical protein LBR21_10910 [Propionibacteriaceae bacterium]|jgi:hypothetical protein|nr:hypothetical protein [Propionibacteriaceae bacterium]
MSDDEKTPENSSEEPPKTGVSELDEALAKVDSTGTAAERAENLESALQTIQQTLK